MAREKPIPRSARKRVINRGTQRSRNDDSVKNISVGLMDIDATIMYYFNHLTLVCKTFKRLYFFHLNNYSNCKFFL